MSVAIIYLFIVAVVTFVICLLYIRSIINHNEELSKIIALEEEERKKEDELKVIRSRINKCPYVNADDARSCYFNSKYRCSWNEDGKICALK